MNTIRCPECDEFMPGAAKYCPVCGISRTSSEHQSDDQWLEIRRSATWRKDVAPSPNRANPVPLPPRPVRSRPPMWNTWRRIRYRISPTLVVWVSLLAFLICGGIFGIVVTRGSGVSKPSNKLALQVAPANVAVGATVMLNGEHFKPYGKIGLTRDTSIPLQDTANATIIEADHSGNFTDTIVITPDWAAGPHTINAEDAFSHKIASFSIMVTGHATSLRPAHLLVSVDTLDLGSGDQATNTTRTIKLTNIGGGLISWQGDSTQSWLILSPASGTFASGHSAQIMVAIDRSKLNPGSYNAQINIFSTAGNNVVPVKAVVTALVPGHRAVLQVNPAMLSFTASDGGPSPSSQTITVSNPGLLPLQWQATTDTNWLFVSPQSASIDPSGNLSVTVNVNSSLLLPGTYTGAITLSTQEPGSAVGSPQTVFVTVTIIPQCSLLVAPGQLNFASIYLQGTPAATAISIAAPQGCNAPVSWQAASNASWLTIDTTSGQAPAAPKVGIDASGLSPGVYSSSIIFSSTSGTQTLPVTFTLSLVPLPLVTTAPAAISFAGIAGQLGPALQKIAITNSGDAGALNWTATATGGDWLAIYPPTGILMAHQSASFSITASVLPTLVPGTYSGTVTIIGTDSSGHPALGSPQLIPVSLVVQPVCTFTVAPGTLNFAGISGQAAPINQQVALLVSPSCTNKLNWATSTSGDNWLSASVMGTIAPVVNVSATLAPLATRNYSGTVIITAQDSVTGLLVGSPQVIPIALTVQPACTLQTPSPIAEAFATTAGSKQASQSFTISVIGTCSGGVTITPSILYNSGTAWLSVATNTTAIVSGESATFTVTVTSASLPAGKYEAIIRLSGSNGGMIIVSSPQEVDVKLNIGVPLDPIMGTPIPTPSPIPVSTSTPTPTSTPSPTPVAALTPVATTTV